MNFTEIIILSVALAIDAMIVSFSYGIMLKTDRFSNALKLALSFGLFQFIMPVFGWNLTGLIYNYIKSYSKWVVFTVFLVLGLKFLKEAFEKKEETSTCRISFLCLLCLAISTSIDAFGAGVSVKCLNSPIFIPSALIGIITFLLSFCGFFATVLLQKFPSKNIEITGALLLLYLAVKSII